MTLDTIIAAFIVAAILGGAIVYLVRAKKKGVKCIGCPHGANCGGKCSGQCTGCGEAETK